MTADAPEGPVWRRAAQPVLDLADRTPPDRDRVIDAVRAASIVVVVVWHWTLSITHRADDGRLVNPNPLDDIPLGWAPTWVLQVMPLFFVVGGFANARGWWSTVDGGGVDGGGVDGAVEFWRTRARRLLAPPAVFAAVWVAIDVGAHLVLDDHRSVFRTATIVFIPLWFLGAYVWVVTVTPLTATWHRQRPWLTLLGLFAVVAVADTARFAADLEAARWVNVVVVWVAIHQLGYFWADGTLASWPRSRALVVAVGGIGALALVTTLPAYPRSLVATADAEISHMYPPTAVVVIVAVAQLGLLTALRPTLAETVRRRRAWIAVVALNVVVMTIFLWHMTALWIVIRVVEAAGWTISGEATLVWWLARPFWFFAPLVVLIPFIAVFGRIEIGRPPGAPRRRSRRRADRRGLDRS